MAVCYDSDVMMSLHLMH